MHSLWRDGFVGKVSERCYFRAGRSIAELFGFGAGDLAACSVMTPQPDGGLMQVRFEWDAASLPHLQLWHNLQPRVCVLSVEPCTSARREGGLSDQEQSLAPGEIRRYVVRVSVGVEAG